jgi:hypothetical protein
MGKSGSIAGDVLEKLLAEQRTMRPRQLQRGRIFFASTESDHTTFRRNFARKQRLTGLAQKPPDDSPPISKGVG